MSITNLVEHFYHIKGYTSFNDFTEQEKTQILSICKNDNIENYVDSIFNKTIEDSKNSNGIGGNFFYELKE